MNSPGRYLTLLPPIKGANAFSGTPYFTESPGDPAKMWDSTINFQYMPEAVHYLGGRGWLWPCEHSLLSRAPRSDTPGGNHLYPQYYTCLTGVTAGTADLARATAARGGTGTVWFPDLLRSEAKIYTGILVQF